MMYCMTAPYPNGGNCGDAWLYRVTGRKSRERFDAVGVGCKWPATPGVGAHYSAAALSGHVAVGAGTLIWRDLQKFQRDITEGRPAVNL